MYDMHPGGVLSRPSKAPSLPLGLDQISLPSMAVLNGTAEAAADPGAAQLPSVELDEGEGSEVRPHAPAVTLVVSVRPSASQPDCQGGCP